MFLFLEILSIFDEISDPSQIQLGNSFNNSSLNKPVPQARSSKYFGFFNTVLGLY